MASALWNDPVRRGCDQSDKSARPTSFWLVAATGNWVAYSLSPSSD